MSRAAVLAALFAAAPAWAEPTFLDQIEATLTVGDASCATLKADAAAAQAWLMGAVAGMRRANRDAYRLAGAGRARFDEPEQLSFARQLCDAPANPPLTLGEIAARIMTEDRRRRSTP